MKPLLEAIARKGVPEKDFQINSESMFTYKGESFISYLDVCEIIDRSENMDDAAERLLRYPTLLRRRGVAGAATLLREMAERGLNRHLLDIRNGKLLYGHKVVAPWVKISKLLATPEGCDKLAHLIRGDVPTRKLVFFDFETNGLENCSVLSASALRVKFVDGKFLFAGALNRFYLPLQGEGFNEKAKKVHGLSLFKLRRYRRDTGAEYPEHFIEDKEFENFMKWGEVFVAHNVLFDRRFLQFKAPEEFCTMRTSAGVIKLKWDDYRHSWKFPKLVEAARKFDITVEKKRLHGSAYDTYLAYRIFKAMYKRKVPEVMDVLKIKEFVDV